MTGFGEARAFRTTGGRSRSRSGRSTTGTSSSSPSSPTRTRRSSPSSSGSSASRSAGDGPPQPGPGRPAEAGRRLSAQPRRPGATATSSRPRASRSNPRGPARPARGRRGAEVLPSRTPTRTGRRWRSCLRGPPRSSRRSRLEEGRAMADELLALGRTIAGEPRPDRRARPRGRQRLPEAARSTGCQAMVKGPGGHVEPKDLIREVAILAERADISRGSRPPPAPTWRSIRPR